MWDTVPGPFRLEELCRRYRFENLHLDQNVKCGVHILSIDESRKSFDPLLWDSCEGHRDYGSKLASWSDSDICVAGYRTAFLSTISLLLMIERLAQHCSTSCSLRTDDIEKILLPIIEREEVAINDEWKGYPGKYFKFSTERLRIAYELPGQGHAIHPIVDHILGREITVRSQRAKYSPSFAVINSPNGLPPANAPFQSDFGKKLKTILDRRFPILKR